MLKQDPALIAQGFYQELTNLISPVEGNVSIRLGTQQLTAFSAGTFLHSIGYLGEDETGAVNDTRYVGYGALLQRTASTLHPGSSSPMVFNTIASGISDTSKTLQQQRFQSIEVSLNTFGDAYIMFACELKMLKDNGAFSSAQNWGIVPPVYPATANLTMATGGPPAFTGAEVPYTYVYTYRNSSTLSESNPSLYQLVTGITPNGFQIEVALGGSSDPQVDTIYVYRAGGSFGDGLYRFIGSIPNGLPTEYYFDTSTDASIAANNILETDNDPPVPSGLPLPWAGSIPSYTSGTGAPGAVSRITPGLITGPTGFWPKVGDPILVAKGNARQNPELCYVVATDGSTYIDLYFQLDHSGINSGVKLYVSCDTEVNSPCNIALFALGACFLAGNKWSPHILYKSKPGFPESWGVLVQDTGVSDSIIVTDPENPIKGLFEFGGGVIVLAYKAIYYVGVFNGVMQTPQKTPAQHGCVSSAACCRVMNEIWYVSFDGVYSYSGGIESWRSEGIDPLFRGISVGSYPAIDFTEGVQASGVDGLTIAYDGTDIILGYLGVDGKDYSLRYNTKLKRWSIDLFGFSQVLNGSGLITAQNVEFDAGYRMIGVNYGYPSTVPILMLADSGTSDNWTTTPGGGDEIPFFANMQTLDWSPSVDKLFSDVLLECNNDNNSLALQTYYNFSPTPDATDTFSIAQPGSPVGRARYPFSFHNSSGVIAYACAVRIGGDSLLGCTLYSITIHYSDEVNLTKGLAMAYSEIGYIGDKTFRNVLLDIDTSGYAVEVFLDVDGVETDLGPITTTTADRARIVAVPSNITGKMVRVRLVPTTNATTNLYSINFDKYDEPLATVFWDSGDLTFQWNGYSFIKQAWWMYTSNSPVTVQFYSDDVAFYSVTLPAHTGDKRLVERFYFPAINGGVLNKAKTHRFTMTSSSPVRFYSDSSRLEWLPIGADQRAGYQQQFLSELIAPK